MAQMNGARHRPFVIASRGDQSRTSTTLFSQCVRDAFDMTRADPDFRASGQEPYADKAAQQRPSKAYKPKH